MFEDPKHPQSRYMYMWLIDHDTVAGADSSDQDAVVRWIEAYLSA